MPCPAMLPDVAGLNLTPLVQVHHFEVFCGILRLYDTKLQIENIQVLVYFFDVFFSQMFSAKEIELEVSEIEREKDEAEKTKSKKSA